MQTGHITSLDHDKEFGLIKSKSGEEVHFHKQCLWNIQFSELKNGQEVDFEMQLTYNGFLGFEIRPAER